MVPGYIQSKSAILWSREKQKMLFLPKYDDDVWIDSIDGIDALGLFGVHKEAFSCPECRTIVIP
jgi:hypothetical protein